MIIKKTLEKDEYKHNHINNLLMFAMRILLNLTQYIYELCCQKPNIGNSAAMLLTVSLNLLIFTWTKNYAGMFISINFQSNYQKLMQ